MFVKRSCVGESIRDFLVSVEAVIHSWGTAGHVVRGERRASEPLWASFWTVTGVNGWEAGDSFTNIVHQDFDTYVTFDYKRHDSIRHS